MKLLEKLREMFPRELQDEVWTAYVGRALSLDFPQLAKNTWHSIRYGMRKGMRQDPILARQEYWKAIENWDEVMEEDRQHTERLRREQIPVAPEQPEADEFREIYDRWAISDPHGPDLYNTYGPVGLGFSFGTSLTTRGDK